MTMSYQTVAVHAGSHVIPAYCDRATQVKTPAQIAYCARLGWDEPATGGASLAHSIGVPGSAALFFAVIGLIILGLIARKRASVGTAA